MKIGSEQLGHEIPDKKEWVDKRKQEKHQQIFQRWNEDVAKANDLRNPL